MGARWKKLGAVSGLLVCGILLFHSSQARAQGNEDAEYRVKLAFLYRFAQFVHWPTEAFHDPAQPLSICVVGPDPFKGEIAEALRGRTAGGHPVEIRSLKPGSNPRACHMIFFRASEKAAEASILAAVKGSSILTVGETRNFAIRGGAINLTLKENMLNFEINLDVATQSRLEISSKLLALAKIVQPE